MLKVKELGRNEWLFENDWPHGVEDRFDQALELMDGGKFTEAEDLLRDVLLVCPDHIDVWHHLALLLQDGGDILLSYTCTREAVRLGLDALPKDFSWLTSRLAWGHLENRPFLRAYHKLGLHLLEHETASDALDVFARLLAASPNDNLGVRYLMMECHLTLSDWEAALHLAKRYEDDSSPTISYSKVVALLGLGDEAKALQCLRDAVDQHPKVAAELSKSRHVRPKASLPGTITLGGEDEAFSYWERNRVHWAKGSRAHELLHELKRRKEF